MKPRKKIGILLSAAVLTQLLSGCFAANPINSCPAPAPLPSFPQGQRDDGPETSPGPSAEPLEEVSPEPDLWDPAHRLEFQFTPSAGLELPVNGATGYASIELPLWEDLPEGEDGKLDTVYAPPKPEPSPEPEPSPGPADGPSDEPASEPPVQESVPALAEPDQEGFFDDPASAEEAGEPAPTEGGEEESTMPVPTDEVFVDPVVDPTAEVAPEPDPEPTPTPDPLEDALLVLEPGTAFVILGESGDWWQVQTQGVTGWIEHRYCFINLPDVIPSMIYNDTNAYSSVFVSSGKDIPNITGAALYQAKADNPRLGRREFIMPVLYAMAKNVCRAQQNALAEGNTLVLYEGFRPYTAQMAVARNLTALSQADAVVKAGISTAPWNISWFIATGASNHQAGYAMDVSLAKVTEAHVDKIGGYSFVQVDRYEEYTMPTPIHELSKAAATFTGPVASHSPTAWKSAKLSDAMSHNDPALALQRYCTDAGLTPLASEWWHFNDLASYNAARSNPSTGNYEITVCRSTLP